MTFAVTLRIKRFRTMEADLRHGMEVLVARFCSVTGYSLSRVGSESIGDNAFFRRLLTRDCGFNVRTYDRVVKWPEGAEWPADVKRPASAKTEAA